MSKQTEELIQEYGVGILTEILDLVEITGEEPDTWRNFALKYKIIKKTTKIIRPQIRKRYVTERYMMGENGVWGNYAVEPHYLYYIVLANGNGVHVFHTKFTNLDIEKWRGKI